MSWIVSAIKNSPKIHGIDSTAWKVEQIRNVILERFGTSYSQSYLTNLIRELVLAYRVTYPAAELAS